MARLGRERRAGAQPETGGGVLSFQPARDGAAEQGPKREDIVTPLVSAVAQTVVHVLSALPVLVLLSNGLKVVQAE